MGIEKDEDEDGKILYKRRDDATRPGIETDMIYFTWVQLYLCLEKINMMIIIIVIIIIIIIFTTTLLYYPRYFLSSTLSGLTFNS